jgi:hypothetical protein
MKRRTQLSLAIIIGLLTVLGLFWGCNDDCTTCPGLMSLDAIWPNADGNWWQYEYSSRTWDQDLFLYTDSLDVPPAPTLDQLIAILGNQPIGDNVTTVQENYQLRFDGLATTGSGVTAQNLEETVYNEPLGASLQLPGGEERILLGILAARPDLADRIVPMLERSAKTLPSPIAEYISGFQAPQTEASLRASNPLAVLDLGPLLLHGGAWWMTIDWIGTYGDLEQRLAWKFLEQDLRTGHEFAYQLIPSLANDVFMHCRITGRRTFKTPAGTFHNAIVAFYMIDYGVLGYVGLQEPAYARVIDYGSVVYAPNYGPIHCYERNFVYVGDGELGTGFGDKTLDLLDGSLIED